MLTMTDRAVADNRVQARYELDRAMNSPAPEMATSDWAVKWGRVLLDYADSAPSEDDTAEEIRKAELAASDAEQSASERADAIRTAISKLDAVVAELENSL